MSLCHLASDCPPSPPSSPPSSLTPATLPSRQLLLLLTIAISSMLVVSPALEATFTIENNCDYKVWPGILSSAGTAPLSTTGFSLDPKESTSVDLPSGWSGRLWGRTLCSTDSTGKFTCATGNCGSGQIPCRVHPQISTTSSSFKLTSPPFLQCHSPTALTSTLPPNFHHFLFLPPLPLHSTPSPFLLSLHPTPIPTPTPTPKLRLVIFRSPAHKAPKPNPLTSSSPTSFSPSSLPLDFSTLDPSSPPDPGVYCPTLPSPLPLAVNTP